MMTAHSGNVKAVVIRFVVVQSLATIDFVSYPTIAASSPMVFNATTPGFYVYYWDFGDGTYYYNPYGGGSLASHTYSRSGTYFVVLSGYNNTGVYSTASHVLTVGCDGVAVDFSYPSSTYVVCSVYP